MVCQNIKSDIVDFFLIFRITLDINLSSFVEFKWTEYYRVLTLLYVQNQIQIQNFSLNFLYKVVF